MGPEITSCRDSTGVPIEENGFGGGRACVHAKDEVHPRPEWNRPGILDPGYAMGEPAQRLALGEPPGIRRFHPGIEGGQRLSAVFAGSHGGAGSLQIAALRRHVESSLRQQARQFIDQLCALRESAREQHVTVRPAARHNQRDDLRSQAGDQRACDVRGRALAFVQLVGSIRLAVDRAPGGQCHAAPVSRRRNPGRQVQIHPPELLNEEFAAAGRTAAARHHPADTAAGHAVDDKALAPQRNDQIRVQAEMSQRGFNANRLRKVRKRKERKRLGTGHDGAVGNPAAVVQHQADRMARVSTVPPDIGLDCAISREDAPFSPRRRRYSSPRKRRREQESVPPAVRSIFGPPDPSLRIHLPSRM